MWRGRGGGGLKEKKINAKILLKMSIVFLPEIFSWYPSSITRECPSKINRGRIAPTLIPSAEIDTQSRDGQGEKKYFGERFFFCLYVKFFFPPFFSSISLSYYPFRLRLVTIYYLRVSIDRAVDGRMKTEWKRMGQLAGE